VLDLTWLDIVSECLCSALLPACPRPPKTTCVPLAVITIGNGDCRVAEICNWSERKLLISWPTITYWFSWLPWHLVWKWISGICCGPERSAEAYRLLTLMLGVVVSGAKASGASPMLGAAVPAGGVNANIVKRRVQPPAAAPRADRLRDAFESDNLLTHMLGEFTRLRAEGAEAVEEPGWAGLIARASDASVLSPRAADDPKLAALLRRIDSAEARLLQHDKDLAEVKKKGGK